VLAEKRVLDLCGAPGRPAWVLGARRASPEEDARGIDVVVESDVGLGRRRAPMLLTRRRSPGLG
jgi:hypothetical protein